MQMHVREGVNLITSSRSLIAVEACGKDKIVQTRRYGKPAQMMVWKVDLHCPSLKFARPHCVHEHLQEAEVALVHLRYGVGDVGMLSAVCGCCAVWCRIG